MSPSLAIPGPVASSERLAAVDTLRGVAVLGILVMNIGSFDLPMMAYVNPFADGREFEGPREWAWWVQRLLFDQKMMSIFSMLFGAGLVLMGDRAAARGAVGVAGLYYRRLLWLFVIGMLHAYLVWYGDILVAYALCGLLLYPLRNLRPRWLIIIGLAVTMVAVVLSMGMGAALWFLREGAQEAQRALDAGRTLSSEQEGMLKGWNEARQGFEPSAEQVVQEVNAMREGWASCMAKNAGSALFMQTFLFIIWTLWRSLGMMLLGMGLMKLGVFSAARSTRFYWSLAALGFGLGLPLVAFGAIRGVSHRFDMVREYLVDGQFNYIASIGVALGHVGVVMLCVKADVLTWLQRRLAAVGQMALTNYLMQSVICTFVFYGWGLGLFNRFDRAQIMLVVVGVWMLELAWSPWWLSRFRFGPAEWLWRSLTYLKVQPMARGGPSGAFLGE
ncbi:hypothetical protein PHYC_01135 [Phycisphaerales bacterium]|nr:hypothetical protein PHYC_01135 [Phycisphaerales bacterium]